MLVKRSKEDIKNVDHMMINHDIATERICSAKWGSGEVIFATDYGKTDQPWPTPNYHKILNSPFSSPPTTISEIISPINLSCLKSLPTPFIKGGRTIMITKIDYTNITKKRLIKQKKIVSSVKDEEEIVNFIKLKTTNNYWY